GVVVDGQLLALAGFDAYEAIAGAFGEELTERYFRLGGKLFLQHPLGGAALGMHAQDERRGKADLVLDVAGDLEDHVRTSSVHTRKDWSIEVPKDVLIATSAASRPRAMRLRPMRGAVWRASKVYQ